MIKEIISIILISLVVGFTYNHFRPDGLELFRTKAPELTDAELFANKSNDSSEKDNIKQVTEAEKTLTYKQMLDNLENPDVVYVDARNVEEYEKDRIGNAINLFPHGDLDELMEQIMELDEGKTYFLYCNSSTCDLSHELKEFMTAFLDNVYIFEGGWAEWAEMQNKR